MSVERTDEMVDIVGRPLYIGDVVTIPHSYGVRAYAFIIKHFSRCGIYGWRMTPYAWGATSMQIRVSGTIQSEKLWCESRYSVHPWGAKRGFNNRVTKIDKEHLDINETDLVKILTLMGIKNEFKPTGSIRL